MRTKTNKTKRKKEKTTIKTVSRKSPICEDENLKGLYIDGSVNKRLKVSVKESPLKESVSN